MRPIPSTYVAFFGGLLATFCRLVGTLFLADGHQAASQSFSFGDVVPNQPGDYTMLIAAVIVEAAAVLWCWWYNWKRTEAAVLAVSVTALQVVLGSGLLVFFWLRFGSAGDRSAPERFDT